MTRMSFDRGVEAWGKNDSLPAGAPSAVLALLPLPLIVPLFSVSSIGLSESFHLPPIGSAGARVLMDTHDDTITMSAVLPGPLRYVWKEGLELMAQLSLGLNPMQSLTGGFTGGLQLWTSMTLRSDMYIKSLTFNATAQKRSVIDVSLSLTHLPRSPLLTLGLEAVGVAAATAIELDKTGGAMR